MKQLYRLSFQQFGYYLVKSYHASVGCVDLWPYAAIWVAPLNIYTYIYSMYISYNANPATIKNWFKLRLLFLDMTSYVDQQVDFVSTCQLPPSLLISFKIMLGWTLNMVLDMTNHINKMSSEKEKGPVASVTFFLSKRLKIWLTMIHYQIVWRRASHSYTLCAN